MSWERKNLTSSPSFGDKFPAVDNESDGEDDFEFAFAAPADYPADSAADEVFSAGRILPVYPVFNRNLLLDPDQRNAIADPAKLRSGSTSSTSSEETEEKFCPWNPRSAPQSPDRCLKSSSAGSGAATGSSRRWRLRDLMARRSRSDGKEKLSYVALEKEQSPKPNPNPNSKKEGEGGKKKAKEMDLITAHRLFYGKESTAKGGRAYLPHRSGPAGLFANGNGLSRTTFPF